MTALMLWLSMIALVNHTLSVALRYHRVHRRISSVQVQSASRRRQQNQAATDAGSSPQPFTGAEWFSRGLLQPMCMGGTHDINANAVSVRGFIAKDTTGRMAHTRAIRIPP